MQRPPLTDKNGEVRDLTAADMTLFKPIDQVDPGMADAMAALRNKGGRPKVETPKVHVGFRIAAEVADGIRATGKGYNARVEMVLRDALAKGLLNATPLLPADLWNGDKTR